MNIPQYDEYGDMFQKACVFIDFKAFCVIMILEDSGVDQLSWR